MGVLSQIFAKGADAIVGKVGDIIDNLHTSTEEKGQLKLELERLLLLHFTQVQESVRARFAAVSDIIKSEMSQGDDFTKRARPSVVYFGLVMFTAQMVGQFVGKVVEVPADFVYAWAGIVATWTLGRSYEKVNGPGGSVSKYITGTRSSDSEL